MSAELVPSLEKHSWQKQELPLMCDFWFQQRVAADGNGERAVKVRRCPAAVKRLRESRQSERPPDLQTTRIDF